MTDTGIVFRQIEKKDNKEIADLIRTVFREFGIDKPGTVYFDPTTDNLHALFGVDGSGYWVAEDNGKIVGGCGVYPTPGLPDGCAELVKLYLSASHRGRGIGWTLMKKTFKMARELGYSKLYLESLPELGKAISLYESAGFRKLSGPMGDSGHFGCNIWMIADL
ncbi:MAG TPA: GNAT family N-acetyltransferase [Bacteroidales bacterium]|nr:GNAT family N-acetyltransferase [Bacteroidales bacterium]